MKSFMANPNTVERKWYVIDADGATLGRLVSEVAAVLRDRGKPIFTPHIDCGDYVIVVSTDKVAITGKKLDQKVYCPHSLHVGGMRETTLRELKAKESEKVIENAVKDMLPERPLGVQMYKKLHIYAGENHNHRAQKPEILTIKG